MAPSVMQSLGAGVVFGGEDLASYDESELDQISSGVVGALLVAIGASPGAVGSVSL
jgi:hypothetical protein